METTRPGDPVRELDPEIGALEDDLQALRDAAAARERAVPGSPEWQASLRHEEALIARVRGWTYGERHGS
jgi:hypothetical protein